LLTPFGAFIGTSPAVHRLNQSLAAERDGGIRCHAYLISGPAQVGKSTLARAMAAALVCTAVALSGDVSGAGDAGPSGPSGPASDGVPCGACRACRLVSRDAHPDVRLVEPESGKRGVTIEQVRQLEHAAGLRPYEGTRKAIIVTSVESMTEPAANALLKTLEEPPADTLLILTASDVSQVLPTIVSRCREVPLRPVPATEIEQALATRGVETEHARVLARLAGGRPGWAFAAAGDPERVAAHTQQVELLEGLLARPRRQRLPAAAGFADAGATRDVLDIWLGWWRDALLVQQDLPDLVANADRIEALRRFGAAHPPTAVWQAMHRIQETRQLVDANVNVRLAVEALLLDLPDPVASPS
jgi:DNA polymerase-3 subunit delta'